jgi:4'-phosphopantetheinyl transferase EntD
MITESHHTSSWISRVVPNDVVGIETRYEGDATAVLLPEEVEALGVVAERRRREFAAGRNCARAALRALGNAPVPVLRGSQRQPIWPLGIVGSISHCHGYCAAVVARGERYAAIAVDAEVHDPLPPEVISLVVANEREWLRTRSGDNVHWDRLVFSAKESVYKAWFTLTGRWLGFEDVCVTIEPDAGIFRSRFLVPGAIVDGEIITEFVGRYLVSGGFIITTVCVQTGSGCPSKRTRQDDTAGFTNQAF